jgi:hypothetical protein
VHRLWLVVVNFQNTEGTPRGQIIKAEAPLHEVTAYRSAYARLVKFHRSFPARYLAIYLCGVPTGESPIGKYPPKELSFSWRHTKNA